MGEGDTCGARGRALDSEHVANVGLEHATVPVQLVVRQSGWQQVRRFDPWPGVVSYNLWQMARTGVLQHGVHQPVAGLGQVSPVYAVAVTKHDL